MKMKKIIIMSILATACTTNQVRQPAIPQNDEVEKQVEQTKVQPQPGTTTIMAPGSMETMVSTPCLWLPILTIA